MSAKEKAAPPTSTGSDGVAKLLKQYGCGPVEFTGTDNALYERHLVFDNGLADRGWIVACHRLRGQPLVQISQEATK